MNVKKYYKNFLLKGAKCKNTWDGETAGYECEKPKMFVLQSGGEQGQFAPYKLHRFGLQETNGKAERFGYQIDIINMIFMHYIVLYSMKC